MTRLVLRMHKTGVEVRTPVRNGSRLVGFIKGDDLVTALEHLDAGATRVVVYAEDEIPGDDIVTDEQVTDPQPAELVDEEAPAVDDAEVIEEPAASEVTDVVEASTDETPAVDETPAPKAKPSRKGKSTPTT